MKTLLLSLLVAFGGLAWADTDITPPQRNTKYSRSVPKGPDTIFCEFSFYRVHHSWYCPKDKDCWADLWDNGLSYGCEDPGEGNCEPLKSKHQLCPDLRPKKP